MIPKREMHPDLESWAQALIAELEQRDQQETPVVLGTYDISNRPTAAIDGQVILEHDAGKIEPIFSWDGAWYDFQGVAK